MFCWDCKISVDLQCKYRSYWTSFRYLFQDLFGIILCIYIGQYIQYIEYTYIQYILNILLCIAQSTLMMGFWVIAHECGHDAFSPNLYVNNIAGCLIHTVLLVPYWSWKYSHHIHHSNTNAIQSDVAYVPYTNKEVDIKYSNYPDRGTPFERLIGILRMVLVGWFAYLFINSSGSRNHRGWISHFNPYCQLFAKKQRLGVIVSDIALLIWIYVLYQWTEMNGVWCMIQFYWVCFLLRL